jgi:phosphohistidine phosphatase
MDFYLVRHGEAVAEVADPGRPLSPAGRVDVEQVARLAAQKTIQVSVICHSGILRARQTAEIFAAYLNPPGGARVMSGLRPGDDPSLAATELALAGSSMMFVGHLPHMKRLGALLTTGDAERDFINFSPAMLACLRREGSSWKLVWTLLPNLS